MCRVVWPQFGNWNGKTTKCAFLIHSEHSLVFFLSRSQYWCTIKCLLVSSIGRSNGAKCPTTRSQRQAYHIPGKCFLYNTNWSTIFQFNLPFLLLNRTISIRYGANTSLTQVEKSYLVYQWLITRNWCRSNENLTFYRSCMDSTMTSLILSMVTMTSYGRMLTSRRSIKNYLTSRTGKCTTHVLYSNEVAWNYVLSNLIASNGVFYSIHVNYAV